MDLAESSIIIFGKGSKERKVQIGNTKIINLLYEYIKVYSNEIQKNSYFFVNNNGTPISDQSVRRMICRYCKAANVNMHITPHMFRHSFASSLLDADVDIRYIQEFLGHSSIQITEIYTHVSTAKQRDILTTKHPRNKFNI